MGLAVFVSFKSVSLPLGDVLSREARVKGLGSRVTNISGILLGYQRLWFFFSFTFFL